MNWAQFKKKYYYDIRGGATTLTYSNQQTVFQADPSWRSCDVDMEKDKLINKVCQGKKPNL